MVLEGSRDVLECGRCAVYRRHEVESELRGIQWAYDHAVSARPSERGPHGSGTHSDPTASAATSEWSERRMGVLRGDLSTLTEQIGDAGAMIERVRSGLGDVYADVLEAYYIDAPDDEWARGMRFHAITWAMVADDLGLSEDAARKRRDRACSWLDMSV